MYDEIPMNNLNSLLRNELSRRYDILLKKYIDLVYIDEYDDFIDKDFDKELLRFLKDKVFPFSHFSKQDWDFLVLSASVEFSKLTKERGDHERWIKCPEAEAYSKTYAKDNYEFLMSYWCEVGKFTLDEDFDYADFSKKLEDILEPLLYEEFPVYFHSKFLKYCCDLACYSFFDIVFERKDDRVFTVLDNNSSSSSSTVHNGISYEDYVASLLEDAGYEVETTPTTGDQGVDLIARKNYLSIAIQCKYWQNNVGNSAVQEVFAGSKYYGTTYRAVVTNEGYTSSAEDLADHLHVLLLTDDELIENIEPLFDID